MARDGIEIRIAVDSADIAQVFAIRAVVYMAGQDCPYEEEFDGNDYCSMHLLACAGGKVVATARLRFFAEFAKIERVAVLPRFQDMGIGSELVDAACEMCRRKGYKLVYAQIQRRLEDFWHRAGFERLGKNRQLVFSDHEYTEMVCRLRPHTDRITLESDPLIIIRPEGRWDHPGVLDASAIRPATNPH
jgi:predicted GNAT family N-acyltransferase